MRDEVAPIKDVLGPITERLGLGNATETAAVWRRWPQIVGPGVVDHAQPTSLRDGVLRIRVDSPIWATEIGYLAEEIRGRINTEVGREAVREVVVWTGPGGPRRGLGDAAGEVPRQISPPGPPPDPVVALHRARAAWERLRSRRR